MPMPTTVETSHEEKVAIWLDLLGFATTGGVNPGSTRQIVRRLDELGVSREDMARQSQTPIELLNALCPEVTPRQVRSDELPADLAREVGLAHQQSIAAQARVTRAVRAAREGGVSWEMIGAMLGIARQSAQARFGGKDAA